MMRGKNRPLHDLTVVLVVFFTIVWALFIQSRNYSASDASRMASVESLVYRGTWVIDDAALSRKDRIKVGEHFYSSKPPTLSFIAAGVYAVLYHGFDLTLQTEKCEPDVTATHCRALLELGSADWAYFILTLLLVSTPGTLMLALAYRLGRQYGLGNVYALSLTVILGLGTAIFPYSVVFVNHVPAAACTFAALHILLTREQPSPGQLMLAGFLATLAVTLDLSAGAFLVALFGYIIWRYQSRVSWFILGGAVPALVMAVLDYQITGNVFPPQLFAQGYEYEGSRLYGNIGGNRQSDNIPQYAFDMLLGENGVLAFYPVLGWFLYAWIKAALSGRTQIRMLAWSVGFGVLAYTAYFVLFTNNFGGGAYSPRWLLNPVPVLAAFAFVNPDLSPRSWRAGIFYLLAAISLVGAYHGALNPWKPANPLFRLTHALPNNSQQYVQVALSGYGSFDDVNPTIRRSLGVNYVWRRWFDARAGFVIPDGEAWWFVHDSTPVSPHVAQPLGLDVQTEYALHADLTDRAREWLETFGTDAFQSVSLVPSGDDELTAVPIPARFTLDNNSMTLLGCRIEQSASELTLVTAWQIETRMLPTGQRKVFAHLLATDGTVMVQNDSFSADYESLFPGDLFFQVQTMSLAEVQPGSYWLQLGVYNPDTGRRLRTADQDRLLLQRVERVGSDSE